MVQTVSADDVPCGEAAAFSVAVPPTPETGEIDFSQWGPDPAPKPLKPLGLKDMVRIVVLGTKTRLGPPELLGSLIRKKPVGQISYPDSLFEAGICCASADVVIFDLVGIDFGAMLDVVTLLKQYNPRTRTFALLEPDAPLQGIPECGLSGVTANVTPENIASLIETFL